MKRRMNLLALLLLVAMVGRAQGDNEAAGRWSVTPHVGANLWMAKYVVKDLPVETGDKALGLTAGAELGCELAPKVNMSLGADYVLQRFSMPSSSSANDRKESYTVSTGRLCFPLLVGVRIWPWLSLRTGIQMGLNLHTNKAEVDLPLNSPSGKRTVKYHFDAVHWYLPVSLSYEYRRWVADLRYYYSLKKNHWSYDENYVSYWGVKEFWTDDHDHMLQLTLGYRLNL